MAELRDSVAKSEPYRLTTPCTDCPFRTDKPFFLATGRAEEIAEATSDPGGGEFHCHKTTEETGTGKVAVCAGWLIVMEKSYGANQMMRISERLGMYDASRLDMDAPVYDSLEDFIEAKEAMDG